MARPFKQRFVGTLPVIETFKPQGVPLAHLTLATLTLDELEAIRLADFQGDRHEEAAAKMNVSRPTFSRILDRAHRTVADALLHGKALTMSGGPVRQARRGRIRCGRCSRAWEVPLPAAPTFHCPRCATEE